VKKPAFCSPQGSSSAQRQPTAHSDQHSPWKFNSVQQDNRKSALRSILMKRVTIPPKKSCEIFWPKRDAYQKLISFFMQTCNLSMRRESCVRANDNLVQQTWPN
jgi:hypothetical protein